MNAYPKTLAVVAMSPDHEKAIMAVVADATFTYVPIEFPKAVGGQVVNSAEEEAALKGTAAPVAAAHVKGRKRLGRNK